MIPKNKITVGTAVASIGAFFVLLLYFHFIYHFSINIPISDDFDAILGFANNFSSASVSEKIILLFSQHNEHRIVLCRLLTLLSYYLKGSIDFKLLNFIGNTSLLGLIALFFITAKDSNKKMTPLYFLPAVLLLFQPGYGASMIIPMASISNLFVLFFALLSLFLLTKRSNSKFLLSLLFATLATFTNGNGMFVFVIGLFSLFYQRRFKESLIWFFFAALNIMFYFTGYTKPLNGPNVIETLLNHPKTIVKFFLNILNPMNCIFLNKSPFFRYLTGTLTLSYFLYLCLIKYFRKNLALFSFLLFLFFSCLTLSIFRTSLGLELSLSKKYAIIPVLIFVSFYFATIEILPERLLRRIFSFILILTILFNVYSYGKNFPALVRNKVWISESVISWNLNDESNSRLIFPDKKRAHSILSIAVQKRLYAPPAE